MYLIATTFITQATKHQDTPESAGKIILSSFCSATFCRLELAKASSKDVNVAEFTGHFCVPEPFLSTKKDNDQLGDVILKTLCIYICTWDLELAYLYIFL